MKESLSELKTLTNKLLKQELPDLKALTEKLREVDDGKSTTCSACEVYKAVALSAFEKYYNAIIALEMQMQLLTRKTAGKRGKKP